MEWIEDRNPNSPGMYSVYNTNSNSLPQCFGFGYFDGNGWILPSQAGTQIYPYRSSPVWSVIDWGKDGMD